MTVTVLPCGNPSEGDEIIRNAACPLQVRMLELRRNAEAMARWLRVLACKAADLCSILPSVHVKPDAKRHMYL